MASRTKLEWHYLLDVTKWQIIAKSTTLDLLERWAVGSAIDDYDIRSESAPFSDVYKLTELKQLYSHTADHQQMFTDKAVANRELFVALTSKEGITIIDEDTEMPEVTADADADADTSTQPPADAVTKPADDAQPTDDSSVAKSENKGAKTGNGEDAKTKTKSAKDAKTKAAKTEKKSRNPSVHMDSMIARTEGDAKLNPDTRAGIIYGHIPDDGSKVKVSDVIESVVDVGMGLVRSKGEADPKYIRGYLAGMVRRGHVKVVS